MMRVYSIIRQTQHKGLAFPYRWMYGARKPKFPSPGYPDNWTDHTDHDHPFAELLMRLSHWLIPALCVISAPGASSQTAPRPRWADAVDSLMSAELARTGTPGAQIAVVENGRLAYTRGYGLADVETGRTVNERTLFQIASVSKLVTATLLAQLASQGTIDLRAPISRYVTELAGQRVGTATVHQLLTHSAGWRDRAVPDGRTDASALGEAMRALGDTMVMTEPGVVFSYSNPSFSMAGYVAERAAGRPFGVLVDSILLRPLGMPRATHQPMIAMTRDFSQGHEGSPGRPAVVRPMPTSSGEWPAGFLYASAGDLARLAMALMDGGTIEGTRVFTADAVRSITTGYIIVPGTQFGHSGYGMHVDSVGGHRRWQKNGRVQGFGALMTMWPAQKLAIIVLANRQDDLPERATALTAQAVAGIAPPVEPTVVERAPTPAERAALVGRYQTGAGNIIQIREANGGLEMIRPRYTVPIRMTGSDRLVVTLPTGEAVDYVVVRDGAGAVRFLHSRGRAFPRLP
jgi:CubicO group peptidase (beta-lactamase class C family)